MQSLDAAISLRLVRTTNKNMDRNLSLSNNQLDRTEQKLISGILGILTPFIPESFESFLLVLQVGIGVIVLATIGLAILLSYLLWKWITTSNKEDGNTSVPDPSAEETRSIESVDQLITDGNKAIEANKQAYRNNEFATAVESLSNAIEYYEAAVDQISNPNKIANLEETISDARAEKTRIESITTVQTAVKEALQTGERNFKEAIARYAADNQTVARIRFRQARDAFEEAQQAVDDSDTEVLAQPIEVNFEQEVTLPSMAIEDLAALDESTVETLAGVDTESITDLETDGGEIIPTVVSDLQQRDEITDEEATLLTILSWWYEGDSREFGSEAELLHRSEQADYGFDQCT